MRVSTIVGKVCIVQNFSAGQNTDLECFCFHLNQSQRRDMNILSYYYEYLKLRFKCIMAKNNRDILFLTAKDSTELKLKLSLTKTTWTNNFYLLVSMAYQ